MAEPRQLSVRALLLLALLALAPVPLTAQPAPPIGRAQAELPRIPLTLVARGKRHRYSVEVAASPAQQAAGMMYRTRMARSHGMLFPFVPPRSAGFWMENTVLPLDLVFLGSDGRVRNIAADAVPFSRAIILSDGAVAAVLELNAGEAARIGLKPGDAVDYRWPG